jgi:pyruvyltransferase
MRRKIPPVLCRTDGFSSRHRPSTPSLRPLALRSNHPMIASRRRVRLFSWNPRRSRLPSRIDARVPVGRRINNFGDLVGPMLVRRAIQDLNLDAKRANRHTTLFSVGSVLHFAKTGDVIWGSGRNGKVADNIHKFGNLDIRAVRGPLTGDFLRARGIDVPDVYGDPALLLPHYYPELVRLSENKLYPVTYVPNLNDVGAEPYRGLEPDLQLDPRSPFSVCIARIVQSERIIGSSLHGIVIAEAFGIPAVGLHSSSESAWKYDDYYLGTGRGYGLLAPDVESAQRAVVPKPLFDADALIHSFPSDLWRPRR